MDTTQHQTPGLTETLTQVSQRLFHDEDGSADLLGLSVRTLQRWRAEGSGPVFHKLGRRVVYSRVDLLEFAAARRFQSISEADEAGMAMRGSRRRGR